MREFEIAGRMIGPGHPCFIVAEAGVNHNGDVEMARRLVDVAVDAGADAVKFQSFKARDLVSPSAPKADYQLETTSAGESQLEMLRKLEISAEDHVKLQTYCHERGILFMSTPFDEGSADLLADLDVPVFKIPSGEVTSWPFLEYVARKGKPIILSTGMARLGEVDDAIRVIRAAGCYRLAVLHCVTDYPANPADVNLRAMQTMAVAFDLPVGYSDHTTGIETPLAAVAMGACVIEKHFTLDKTLPGPDHGASLEPVELAGMVSGIRTVESALGNGRKEPASAEESNRHIARRSLAAARDIPDGTVLQRDMLTLLRPGDGISPTLLHTILGRRVRRSVQSRELLTWDNLE